MTRAPAPSRLGGIEAGGTKFVLGIGDAGGRLFERHVLPTTTPGETIEAAIRWFRSHEPVAALGIASFGPVQLDRTTADWGSITATTKPGWSDTPFAPVLARALGVPVGFDTDVNGAALGEAVFGAAASCDPAVYVTVGTGIGGGAIVGGRPVHGFGHPEMGHLPVARHPDDREFAGTCPFHGDCLEGLASGPAILARWGASLSELPEGHAARPIVAWYLGRFAVTLQALLAPQRIIFGGGVMQAPGMIELVRSEATTAGRGYFAGEIDRVLVAPALGQDAGLVGALLLARAALEEVA